MEEPNALVSTRVPESEWLESPGVTVGHDLVVRSPGTTLDCRLEGPFERVLHLIYASSVIRILLAASCETS